MTRDSPAGPRPVSPAPCVALDDFMRARLRVDIAQPQECVHEDGLRGVRSSCERVARNSSLMRLVSRSSVKRAFSMAIEVICASWVRIASSSWVN